jgi:hypothetical protein
LIPELRSHFNATFKPELYSELLTLLGRRCGSPIPFRVAETPIFVPGNILAQMAEEGAEIAHHLIGDPEYLAAARGAIPAGFDVANQTARPHFLTADFALVRTAGGELAPKLVEIQAFPSVFAYQAVFCGVYREIFRLPGSLRTFLSGLDESSYWDLLCSTILGKHAPENVVLTEVDPLNQKTFPDFHVTSERLGIPIVDIRAIEAKGDGLYYRDRSGRSVRIHRIYNRAIADELIARKVQLTFDLSRPWEVEWAGHPNWYFLISKFSIPWLTRKGSFPVVPPAAFVDDFLGGPGREALVRSGVPLPDGDNAGTVYKDLLLKPLFSFAGKGIEFEPSRARLEAIPPEERGSYLVQQRMRFEPTIETPFGLTQAEIRILYLWPDEGRLTPALSLVRLGRGKMMGVDHNKNQEWVGGSAAFYI